MVSRKSKDIEAENLETHVALCSERYEVMKEKIDRMEDRLSSFEVILTQIKNILAEKENKTYQKLLTVGYSIISFLSVTLIGLAIYVAKLP